MIVYKKFNIESARSLPNLPNEHPCSQIHGHSFEIILKVSGELNEKTGFIIDFQDIEDSFNPIQKLLDHHSSPHTYHNAPMKLTLKLT